MFHPQNLAEEPFVEVNSANQLGPICGVDGHGNTIALFNSRRNILTSCVGITMAAKGSDGHIGGGQPERQRGD